MYFYFLIGMLCLGCLNSDSSAKPFAGDDPKFTQNPLVAQKKRGVFVKRLWPIPPVLASLYIAYRLFRREEKSTSSVSGSHRRYYGIPTSGFPNGFENAVFGLSPERYVFLEVGGDGSCWARAFFYVFLHRIVHDDVFFQHVIDRISEGPEFWSKIPTIQYSKGVDVGSVKALLAELKPLSEKERLERINQTEVDAQIVGWLRHIAAKESIRLGREKEAQQIIQPHSSGNTSAYWNLSAYFEMELHWIGVGIGGKIGHTISTGIDRGLLASITSTKKIGRFFIGPIPLVGSDLETEVILAQLNGHTAVFHRRKGANPLLKTVPGWKLSSWEEIRALYQELPWCFENASFYELHHVEQPQNVRDAAQNIVVGIQNMDAGQILVLQGQIHKLKEGGPEGLGELLNWILEKVKVQSTQKDRCQLLSRVIVTEAVEAFLRWLEKREMAKQQEPPMNKDSSPLFYTQLWQRALLE